MKIIAKYFDFKVNEDLNFALFAVPRPTRDAAGTFVMSAEDAAPDVRCTMLSLEDIDNIGLRPEYKEEIKLLYTDKVYSAPDAFGNHWVIVPCVEAQETVMFKYEKLDNVLRTS